MKIRNRSKNKASLWFVWELEDQPRREAEFVRHLLPEESPETALESEKKEWSHCGGRVFLLAPGEVVTLAGSQTDEELRRKSIAAGAREIVADGGDPYFALARAEKHERWKESN